MSLALTPANRAELAALTLAARLDLARQTVSQALRRYGTGPRGLAVCWTGGKDSTLTLWLAREAALSLGLPVPRAVYIDEGDAFPEVEEFIGELARAWGVEVCVARNDAVLSRVARVGEELKACELPEEERAVLARLALGSFVFDPGEPAGVEILKIIPLMRFVRDEGVRALMVGVRWDEHPARSGEEAARHVPDPAHERVHPILHLTERDVWEATRANGIPSCRLYAYGFRSLGCRSDTRPVSDIPAWEQDLEHTSERAGRGRAKESAMAALRSLGYM